MTRVCIARFGYVNVVVPVEVIPYLGRMVIVEPVGYSGGRRYELDRTSTHDFSFVDASLVNAEAIEPEQVPSVEAA